MFNKKLLMLPILLLFILSIAIVSASDNITEDISSADNLEFSEADNIPISEVEESIDENNLQINSSEVQSEKINTKIQTKDVTSYYKEKTELISYLKDNNNHPISNKKVSIVINNKLYNRITDNLGKIVLKLNLKPNTYKATIMFDGDEEYAKSSTNAFVKINKAPLIISTKNYNTYWHSDLFFKAKVTNKITKNPVEGIKVMFKVNMGNGKYKTYYATTDKNGIAFLKKNFKVGSYKILTSLKKNKNVKIGKKSKSTLTVKQTAEVGCCSFFVQISTTEAITGFRRDGTSAATIKIIASKWYGRTAMKQYKSDSYFFHSITTSDGWMIGTGGIDNPGINKAIEKLAGYMVKSGKIQKTYLKKIQNYEKRLGLGHFSIKMPNGNYALVWGSAISSGKLKAGQFVCVPNGKSCLRHGNFVQFDKNPVKAAIKIITTDPYGVNRRDATVFHWKATTNLGKTTSQINAYATNDNGKLVGRNTGYLKDNIKFKNKFFSKNSLPKSPSSKFLGTHKFGNIDKLIKIQTSVKAPQITVKYNQSKLFKVTVKNKKTNAVIKNLVLKLKINGKVYAIKTNSNGMAQFKTNDLGIGTHNVVLYTDNIRYFVSAKSSIVIEE